MDLVSFGENEECFILEILFTYSMYMEGKTLSCLQYSDIIVANLLSIFYGIVNIINGSVWLFKDYKVKKNESNTETISFSKIKIKNKDTKETDYFFYLNYLFVCLLDLLITFSFLSQNGVWNVGGKVNDETYMNFGTKGLQIFFSVIILKWLSIYDKLGVHRKLGLAFMMTGMVLNVALSFISGNFYWLPLVYQILQNVCSALQESSEKYLMFRKFEDFYRIIFYEGVFKVIVGIIVHIILCIKLERKFFDMDYFAYSVTVYIWLFILGLSIVGYYTLRIMINDKLSQTHRMIADTMISVISCFESMKKLGKVSVSKYFSIFGFILSLSGTLIFNEIFILPFWGLNQDTRNEIAKRGMLEDERDNNINGIINDDQNADQSGEQKEDEKDVSLVYLF